MPGEEKGIGFGSVVGSAALSAIPVLGALGSAALQQKYAVKNWERTNAYNHPREQVKRLREAGLPLASMFTGSGGSQSQSLNTPNIDPTLGSAKGLDNYFTNRMQKKQLELMDQELRIRSADADLKEIGRDWARADYVKEDPNQTLGAIPYSNQVMGLVTEQKAKIAESKASEITADLIEAKTQADIDHVLQTIKLGVQAHEYNEVKQWVDKWIKGEIQEGKMNAFKALLYKFFLKPD